MGEICWRRPAAMICDLPESEALKPHIDYTSVVRGAHKLRVVAYVQTSRPEAFNSV